VNRWIRVSIDPASMSVDASVGAMVAEWRFGGIELPGGIDQSGALAAGGKDTPPTIPAAYARTGPVVAVAGSGTFETSSSAGPRGWPWP